MVLDFAKLVMVSSFISKSLFLNKSCRKKGNDESKLYFLTVLVAFNLIRSLILYDS